MSWNMSFRGVTECSGTLSIREVTECHGRSKFTK